MLNTCEKLSKNCRVTQNYIQIRTTDFHFTHLISSSYIFMILEHEKKGEINELRHSILEKT